MAEAYSVSSRLTLSTNVEAVLKQLIEQFETFDKIVKESKEVLAGFAKETGEVGKGGGTALKDAFAGLKIPQNVMTDLAQIVSDGKAFATSSAEAATAWKEMAAASKSIRNPAPGQGGSGSGGGGGSGRGGGGNGSAGGRGGRGAPWNDFQYNQAEQANERFDLKEDRANAVWQEQDFQKRSKFEADLMATEQKAVLKEIAQREKFEAERDKIERQLLAAEQKAVIDSIAAREKSDRTKYDNDYAKAQYDIRDEKERERQRKSAADEAHYATYGSPEERANAKLQDADYNARKRFQDQQNKGQSHHEFGMGAMGMQMAGDASTSFFENAIGKAFDYEHLFAIITADMRVSADQQKDLRKQVAITSRNVPGSTRAEALEVFTDLKNTFGDFDEAKAELEPMLKLVTTLKMADLKQGGEGNMSQALAMARFIEDQGGAIDPAHPEKYDQAKFDEIAKKAVSIYVATQGRVAPREMLAFQKMARTGGMMMDDHALYEETPYFAQGFGASKLGTAIFSDVQVMLGNRMTPKTEDELGYMGMFGGMKKNKKEKMVWDQDTLREKDLLAHDPYAWIHDVLGAQIAKKLGVDDHTKEGQEAVLLKFTEMAQRSTIAGLWGDVYRNYFPAQKEGRNIAAQDPDMQGHFMKEDPMAQILVFRAAENELMVTLGELLKGPAIEWLKKLTTGLHGIVDFMDAHPKSAEEFVRVAAEVAIGMKILGGVAMAAFFIGPVLKMVGGIAMLGGGLAKLALALIPFEAGGAALAGLAGLEAGAAGLAAAAGGGAAKGGVLKSIMWGGPVAAVGAATYGAFQGARMSGEDIAKHGENGEIPMMMDEFGHAIGYYKPNRPTADSLVSQTSGGPKGTQEDPFVVHVQNQISESGIARGVSSNQSSKMNRPPSGYTGSDVRMDALSLYYAGGG